MSYSSYTKLEDEKISRLLFFGLQSQETCSIYKRFQKKWQFSILQIFFAFIGGFLKYMSNHKFLVNSSEYIYNIE